MKFIEVKYYKKKLTLKEMNKEVEQIKNIQTSFKVEYAFCATSGYEDSNYECIDVDELYSV